MKTSHDVTVLVKKAFDFSWKKIKSGTQKKQKHYVTFTCNTHFLLVTDLKKKKGEVLFKAS